MYSDAIDGLTWAGIAWVPRSSVSRASASGVRVAEVGCAAGVGEVLALTREGELEDGPGERREDDHRERTDHAERPVVVLSAAEDHAELQRVGDAVVMIAPSAAAIDETRMSRFLMWANSWASTPRTWFSGHVAQEADRDGDRRVLLAARPVAKAFGWSDGTM